MDDYQKRVEVDVFQKAKKNNYCCGDSYFYLEKDQTFICALADGLGSGEFAKESSELVVEAIKEHYDKPVKEIIRESNKVLVGKRGVVLGILQMDFEAQQYYYTSIGNIGLVTIADDDIKRRNIPQAGYLSGYDRPYKVVSESLQKGMTFLLFSDGVTPDDLSRIPVIGLEPKGIIEGFAEHYSGELTDDTTIIALKLN